MAALSANPNTARRAKNKSAITESQGTLNAALLESPHGGLMQDNPNLGSGPIQSLNSGLADRPRFHQHASAKLAVMAILIAALGLLLLLSVAIPASPLDKDKSTVVTSAHDESMGVAALSID